MLIKNIVKIERGTLIKGLTVKPFGNYTETSKLDDTCDAKIIDAKRTSLGMMILSLLLFVGLFFILRLNDLFYFSNPFSS